MHVGLSDEDLAHVFHLGRRGTSDDAPRPLMVQLASYSHKNLIMESLFRLKHADSQFKTVIVAHDMTRAEREESKRLVAEAKTLQAQDTSGESLYRVRGNPGKMRVIRIRIRP